MKDIYICKYTPAYSVQLYVAHFSKLQLMLTAVRKVEIIGIRTCCLHIATPVGWFYITFIPNNDLWQ